MELWWKKNGFAQERVSSSEAALGSPRGAELSTAGWGPSCPGWARRCWAASRARPWGGSWCAGGWSRAGTAPSACGCGWWTWRWLHTPGAWRSVGCPGWQWSGWTGSHPPGRSPQSQRHSRCHWGTQSGPAPACALLMSPAPLSSQPWGQRRKLLQHLLGITQRKPSHFYF